MEEALDSQAETLLPTRQSVLEGVRRLLGDGQPRTAKQIGADLAKQGLAGIDKSLVNSVLSREGHDEFAYDRTSYTYSLGGDPATASPDSGEDAPAVKEARGSTSAEAADTPSVPRQAILQGARAILRDGQPRKAREIATELVKRGLAGVDKSLVSSVLSREGKDEFTYDRAAYTYTLGGGVDPLSDAEDRLPRAIRGL